MEWIALAATCIVIALALWHFRPGARAQRRLGRAEQRYLAQIHLPPKLARESLERSVAEKAKRIPNRSRAWYVEQVVEDLRRDRR